MGHIGIDESGKGDYFGYLVVAAVYVDERLRIGLESLRVRDSKRVSDSVIRVMAAEIMKCCPHSVVRISPEKYNGLYSNFKSLNKLLAWGHARALENVLEKVGADYALADQFGDEKFLKNALLEKGRTIRLVQRTKAESDIAVAAASILARDEFVSTLHVLSEKYNIDLPKGATHVEDAARKIVTMHGASVLDKVAKVHFRTTKRIIG